MEKISVIDSAGHDTMKLDEALYISGNYFAWLNKS
jgi:hypothetical protein